MQTEFYNSVRYCIIAAREFSGGELRLFEEGFVQCRNVAVVDLLVRSRRQFLQSCLRDGHDSASFPFYWQAEPK